MENYLHTDEIDDFSVRTNGRASKQRKKKKRKRKRIEYHR